MSTNPYFKFALHAGDEILKRATHTTMGLRFPADSKNGFEGRYEFKLYDGAAGIGIVLLDLFCATKNQRHARIVEEISYGLVTSTPEFPPLLGGLYSGFAGVGFFHLACARIFKQQKFLNHAIEVAKILAQSPHVDTDLFRGAAGTGWLFLALFHATRDQTFLEDARDAASFLQETKIDFGGMYGWPVHDPRQPLPANDDGDIASQTHTGLAHGAAGICLFLLELCTLTEDAATNNLLEGAFQWLDSRSFRQRNATVWPRSDEHRVIQDHWCHGSTGIAQAYLSRYRLLKDDSAFTVAESAAQATWNSLQDNNDEPHCHCHGLAGAMELFLDLANETGEEFWLKRARKIAGRLKNPAAIRRDAMKPESGGPSLGLGTGGVIRQMLRLSGHSIFPILTLNRDPISLKPDWISKKKSSTKVAQNNSIGSDLLPHATIQLKNGRHYVKVDQIPANYTQSILNLISKRPAGSAYFRAVEQVSKACQRWKKKYGDIVVKDAITPAILGRLLREIAGLVLYADGEPAKVTSAAKQLTSGAISAMDLMFERLEVDVSGVLSPEIDGRLVKIQTLGSDPHFGGQRVVALHFENGRVFLYKGRSVALDREFAGSVVGNEAPTLAEKCRSWLQPAIAKAQLPTHRIIVASPNHGYVEQISSSDVVTFEVGDEVVQHQHAPKPQVTRLKEADEKRYWYSAGLMAGHAFSLGMFDLHSENVVSGVSRSTPNISMHAVDLEIGFGNVIDLEDTQLIEGPRWGIENRSHSHTPLGLPSLYCGLYADEWAIALTSNGPQPVEKPWKAVRWIWPHLVQNADGSFGYQKHVCSLLRGFADQWMMIQNHAKEITDHLKEKLIGTSMRVVLNPTRNYVAALLDRKVGGIPITGIALNPALPFARPLVPSETAQLNRLDVPYYFRILGEDAVIYWSDSGKKIQEHSYPAIKTVTPFWSVIENQADPNRFARAVVDLAWQVVPQGLFDFHEPSLGVRIARTQDDDRVVIIIVLNDKRLICKVASEGKIEWWLD
jgi:hypothetical protein